MLVLPDSSFNEILNFLDAIELHGKNIKTVIDPLEEPDDKKTVAYEAKLLKRMFLKLREWRLSNQQNKLHLAPSYKKKGGRSALKEPS